MVYIAESSIPAINEALRLGRHLRRTNPSLAERVLAVARRAHVQDDIALAEEAIRLGGGTPPDPMEGMTREQRVRWRIQQSWQQDAVDHPSVAGLYDLDGVLDVPPCEGTPIEDALDFLLEPPRQEEFPCYRRPRPTQSTDGWDSLEEYDDE